MKLTILVSTILFLALSAAGQKPAEPKAPEPKSAASRILEHLIESEEATAAEMLKSGFTESAPVIQSIRNRVSHLRAARGGDPRLVIDELLVWNDATADPVEQSIILQQIIVIQNEMILKALEKKGP